MTLFAGVDVGTSGARCLIVDERGARTGFGEAAWPYHTDDLGFPTMAPAEVFDAVERAVRTASATSVAADVAGVGITSQRHGLVLMDGAGAEIMMVPSFDARALQEALEQQRDHGDAIYRTTGRLLTMLGLPARLAWFRKHHPEQAERVTVALSLAGWLSYRVAGSVGVDRTLATEMMLYDVAGGGWSSDLMNALDVPRALLPPITEPGEILGNAKELFPGAPVIIAGGDTQCGALAMGVVDPGEAFVVAGTTMLAGMVRDNATAEEQGRLWTSPHAIEGRFLREAHCWEAGPAVEWAARIFGCTVDEFANLAARGVPGAGGITFVDPMPSTANDFPLLRNGGLFFPAALLVLAREREDVARAVFEGIAFGARAGLEWLDDEPSSIAVAGGVARSSVFCDALAGALQRSVRAATEPYSSALGAAICAAAPHHGGVREAIDAMRDRGRDIVPREVDGYPSHYAAWRARAMELDEKTMRMSDFIR